MPTYRIFGWLFPRALAAIYFIAFGSWWFQFAGLTGEQGLMPVPTFLGQASEYAAKNGLHCWLEWPSLYWLHYSDSMAGVVCLAGCAVALLVIAGVWQAPLLLALWAGYLSIVTTGDVFMSFQWDALLLEAGLIAVLISPWRLFTGRPKAGGGISRVGMLLPQLLLIKLMFLSGFVKLESKDETWRDMTALQIHYETQPLPAWTSWWMHQLPAWAHKASCAVMFFVELVLPAVLLAALVLDLRPRAQRFARKLKRTSCIGIVLLMLVVMATGNYTFFNWLTILLALAAMDDRCWPRAVKRVLHAPQEPAPARALWRTATQAALVTAMLALSLMMAVFAERVEMAPEWVQTVMRRVQPFHSVNPYGLFRVMTRERNEIELEVSDDGTFFLPVNFRWKPGEADEAPAFVAPYQPRLDWQMWFAALHPGFLPQRDMAGGRMVWFGRLVEAILEARQPVLDLMEPMPLPPGRIRYVRARFYRYRFTDRETRGKTGEWWTREFLGDFSPVLSKRKG